MLSSDLNSMIRASIANGFYEQGLVDIDGLVDDRKGIQYIGTARRQADGTWQCLANVGGALCLVEVSISIKESND